MLGALGNSIRKRFAGHASNHTPAMRYQAMCASTVMIGAMVVVVEEEEVLMMVVVEGELMMVVVDGGGGGGGDDGEDDQDHEKELTRSNSRMDMVRHILKHIPSK